MEEKGIEKRLVYLGYRGGTLKFVWERSIGQLIELHKSLERNNTFSVCFRSVNLDKFSDLQIGDGVEDKGPRINKQQRIDI